MDSYFDQKRLFEVKNIFMITFLHSTWLCPKVMEFWVQVCNIISQIHGISFPVDPEVCLLGNFTNSNIVKKLS